MRRWAGASVDLVAEDDLQADFDGSHAGGGHGGCGLPGPVQPELRGGGEYLDGPDPR